MTTLTTTEVRSPLGDIRVVATEQALCAVAFADRWSVVAAGLVRRFGDVDPATTAGGAAAIAADALRDYFDGHVTALDDLEVDTLGTPFQRAVWSALRQIPAGTSCSYAELATAVGRARAVRAAGSANGANPVSLVVPCHRVIRTGGHLGGYGGGLDRKRWLLEHERAHRGA